MTQELIVVNEVFLIDNMRYRQVTILAIYIASLHCALFNDEIFFEVSTEEDKLISRVHYPKNPSINLEAETFLRFAIEKIGVAVRMNIIFSPDNPLEEAKTNEIVWETNVLWSSSDCPNSPIPFPEISPLSTSRADCFAELVVQQQELEQHPCRRPSSSNSIRKQYFSHKKCLEKGKGEYNSRFPAYPSFGEVLSSERFEIINDIPEELPEGDLNFCHESLNIQSKFQNDRKLKEFYNKLGKDEIKKTIGLILANNVELQSLLAEEMKAIGISKIIEQTNVNSFFDNTPPFVTRDNITTALVILDICTLAHSFILSVKKKLSEQDVIPELKNVILLGIYCGKCAVCSARKEEERLRKEIPYFLTIPFPRCEIRSALIHLLEP